jgi:hypothetical protein
VKRSPIRILLYGAFILLLLLHNDLWLWENGRLILGFPIGLLYHIGYAVAASALMFLLVRFAWPSHVDVEEDEEGGR